MLDFRTWAKVFTFVVEAIEAITAQFDETATEGQKYDEVKEALVAAYDAADQFAGLPSQADDFVKEKVIPVLLDGSRVAAAKFGWYHPDQDDDAL